MKITIIGAGSVGATAAEYIAIKQLCSEIVLLDIKKGIAEGKAIDLMQASALNGFDVKISGVTSDYTQTKDSGIVIITSGVPRKPGMSREELIGVNAGIVKQVVQQVTAHSPNAILVVVSNPMDVMTYLVHQVSGLPKERIIGMGGALDSARFQYRLAEALGCPLSDVDGMVIGAHTDTGMIPLLSKASRNGIPVEQLLSPEQQDYVSHQTMIGGATLTQLLGISSWYAPGAAIAMLVEAIVLDQKKMIPSSAMLKGEYGQTDICIGVPCIIGKDGIEQIVEVELSSQEKERFNSAVQATREMIGTLAY